MCGVGGGGRDEALTRLMDEDDVEHGNAIAVLIKTRMVVWVVTQCFVTALKHLLAFMGISLRPFLIHSRLRLRQVALGMVLQPKRLYLLATK